MEVVLTEPNDVAEVILLPLRPVVLLIDMQADFLRHFSREARASLIEEQIQLIRFCAEQDVPVVVIEYKGFGYLPKKLVTEVVRVPRWSLVGKLTNDAFEQTKLKDVLSAYGANALVTVGVNASACVLATAQSAIDLDYEVITARTLVDDSEKLKLESSSLELNTSQLWYEEYTLYFETADDLIKMLREEMTQTA